MPCQVTFSPYLVRVPALGGIRVYASDQTVIEPESGLPVRLIGHPFIAQQNDMAHNLTAGFRYLTVEDCGEQEPGGNDDDCPIGSCTIDDDGVDCCYVTEEEFCPGVWGGVGSACPDDENICEERACCYPHGADWCEVLPVSVCSSTGGYPYDADNCDNWPVACRGACCLVNAVCIDNETLSGCRAAGEIAGTWWQFQGPGTLCADIDCPISGACCLIDSWPGGCLQFEDDLQGGPTAQQQCLDAGGEYQGNGTTCEDQAPDGLGICVGACCRPVQPPPNTGGVQDVECENIEFADCQPQAGGTWLGPGTRCGDSNVDCGICCLPSGDTLVCDESIDVVDCVEAGGVPLPTPAHCEACDFILGCCCVPRFRKPEGPPFLPLPPPPPPSPGGDPFDDPIIVPEPPPHRPNLCDFTSFDCVPTQTEVQCNAIGGVWRGYFANPEFMCFFCCQTDEGRCCICDTDDPECCFETTEEECDAAGGTWGGVGTGCPTRNPNPHGPPVFGRCRLPCDVPILEEGVPDP